MGAQLTKTLSLDSRFSPGGTELLSLTQLPPLPSKPFAKPEDRSSRNAFHVGLAVDAAPISKYTVNGIIATTAARGRAFSRRRPCVRRAANRRRFLRSMQLTGFAQREAAAVQDLVSDRATLEAQRFISSRTLAHESALARCRHSGFGVRSSLGTPGSTPSKSLYGAYPHNVVFSCGRPWRGACFARTVTRAIRQLQQLVIGPRSSQPRRSFSAGPFHLRLMAGSTDGLQSRPATVRPLLRGRFLDAAAQAIRGRGAKRHRRPRPFSTALLLSSSWPRRVRVHSGEQE